ncbi:hypothetical protein M885DRAFT_517327 [Pelagophyceae sp. CCMP2097]|nr:hypothetical protein M885DRAFT_517327 [Pelagophyceae sp. CCMP2097]
MDSAREPTMAEVADIVGLSIVALRRAFDDETAVEARSPALSRLGDGTTLALRGALRALRRAGCDVTDGTGARWCRARRRDENSERFKFGAYVRLYHDLTRRFRWVAPLQSDGAAAQPEQGVAQELLGVVSRNGTTALTCGGNAAGPPGRGGDASLLKTLLHAPLHRADAADDAYVPKEDVIAAETMPDEPRRLKRRTVRQAFQKYDMYGDETHAGEVAWADVLPALKCAGVDGDVASLARRADAAPHYPVDLETFQKMVAAHADDAARSSASIEQRKTCDDAARRADAHARFQRDGRAGYAPDEGYAPRGNEAAVEPCMAAETIRIRREALTRRRRREYEEAG